MELILIGAFVKWKVVINQLFKYPPLPDNNKSQAMAPKNGGNMYGILNNARMNPFIGISLRPSNHA